MQEQKFFAIISRMKYINRWGLMRNTINENISEHSLETAFTDSLQLAEKPHLTTHYQ